MASSPDAQQPDTLAPSSSELSQELRPRRIVLLDRNFVTGLTYPGLTYSGLTYRCGNQEYLLHNLPMGNDRDQVILSSLSGSRLDISRDVFYLSKDVVKLRFILMDADPRVYHDPWNSATRPSHLMLDARNMSEVLQEASGGDSTFHMCRKEPENLPCGILDFFQFFGISNPAVWDTLKKITVFVPSRTDDMFGNFEYDSLERVPFLSGDPLSKHHVISFARTETQKEQLNNIMGKWQWLEAQACNLRLPTIEFARHPQT
ncbi:hypothetical protein SLS53_008365 [Cytospora paraplurivora]|uniref:Uncharacterized protein n=1 Tax=Cytospora paraplurivora TaxID=2898453 RepID=A0AAN9YBL0_9PEZI